MIHGLQEPSGRKICMQATTGVARLGIASRRDAQHGESQPIAELNLFLLTMRTAMVPRIRNEWGSRLAVRREGAARISLEGYRRAASASSTSSGSCGAGDQPYPAVRSRT